MGVDGVALPVAPCDGFGDEDEGDGEVEGAFAMDGGAGGGTPLRCRELRMLAMSSRFAACPKVVPPW